jgi:hypothetical protein
MYMHIGKMTVTWLRMVEEAQCGRRLNYVRFDTQNYVMSHVFV